MSQSNPIIYWSNLFSLCITSKQTLFNMLINSTYLHLTAGSFSHSPDKKKTNQKNPHPTQIKQNQEEKNATISISALYNHYSREILPSSSLLYSWSMHSRLPLHINLLQTCYVLCLFQWWKFIMKTRNPTTKHAFKN